MKKMQTYKTNDNKNHTITNKLSKLKDDTYCHPQP